VDGATIGTAKTAENSGSITSSQWLTAFRVSNQCFAECDIIP